MFFNKPLLLNLSSVADIVSVKDMERTYRVDIGGTWLYYPEVFDSETIKLYIRVRYNGTTKEVYQDLIEKVSLFSIKNDHIEFDLGKAIDNDLDFVNVKVVRLEASEFTRIEKMYFLHFIVKEEVLGECEIYIAFPTFSPNTDEMKLLKRITKKVKKYFK